MGFNKKLLEVLNVEENDAVKIFLLLGMGFFIGIFLATLDVGASTLFLNNFDEKEELPVAILVSGILGIVTTAIYNYFQNKVSFRKLAIGSLFLITLILAGIEFGFRTTENLKPLYFFAFTFIVPSNFIVLLIFWGSFGRMFNLRKAKRVIGSVDTGQLIASIIALFSIPLMLKYISTQELLFISLVSIVGNLGMFFIITQKNLFIKKEHEKAQSINYGMIIKDKYIGLMSLFVIISMIAMNFVDYSFLNVTTTQFNEKELPKFLSYFEATVVIFSFLFQTFVTDKIIAIYGLKVSLLINPLLITIFTLMAIPIGYTFGYSEVSETFVIFFVIISMSKLFIASLKDALDGPAFKLYFLPIDSAVRFDVQTKIEGVITAFAGLVAGGLIILINNVKIFSLIHITIFTLPILAIWYFITRKMHHNYKETLQSTLIKNKGKHVSQKEYAINKVLENEINSKADESIIYGLKLMEKLEPALFESSIIRLTESDSRKVKAYANEKLKSLDIEFDRNKELHQLAKKAANDSEDSEVISVPANKLAKLSKSIKTTDRTLAAKLLRKLINDHNIFVLLELLRDIDPRVKMEAIITARKVQRPETWTILIELLDSPTYSNAAASALYESGEAALFTLETAFHKSGQSDQVMLKIVQIMGRIGGPEAIELLWKKIEYPDKRIVKQILLSFRYFNYQAQSREISNLTNLLENEIGKAIWNLAALIEIPGNETRFEQLRNAIKEEISNNEDTIYMILSIMYDPQSVQLVRENVETGTSDGIAFAIELLDLFLDPELKPKLFPLIDDIPIHDKVHQLQVHFPREDYSLIQVLNFILNKNYNQINRWTKACAIYSLVHYPEFRISKGLIAQLFNQDRLLHEVAGWVMYHKDQQAFEKISERLPDQRLKLIHESIENNSVHEGMKDGFFLSIEMVMFLKRLPVFKNIKGILLCDLVDKMYSTHLKAGKSLSIQHNDDEQIIIVAQGEALVMQEESEVQRLKTGEVFGHIFNLDDHREATHIMAFGDAVIFHLSVYNFYNVMANHHELAQGLIKNINYNHQKSFSLNVEN
ncbi:hypothetical protein JMN32_06250 [Fulvivirga sp. 29W222]|uniref:Cyclic nucleotide-binding domain-containing protein n=1 Tax=Fulvivirga marina TaxID=2494733 RepID=A0A937FTV1_9BACT|nr:cyclic nucleotide-binding domain-containing protein [Fulvivirga marina]MBL6445900.1 hypothetical protein [Fulvivirga marina]